MTDDPDNQVKLPPAEAGGLSLETLKGDVCEPLKRHLHTQFQLIITFIFLFLISDIRSDHLLVQPNRGYEIPTSPETFSVKFLPLPNWRAIAIALLPLIKPTTCDTEYLGGNLYTGECDSASFGSPPAKPGVYLLLITFCGTVDRCIAAVLISSWAGPILLRRLIILIASLLSVG